MQLDFAKKMRKQYGENYFAALQWISAVQNDDTAAGLLLDTTKKINGYFNQEEIQLFDGLCRLAYECKKIKTESYRDFQKWLEYANKQLENEVVTKEKFHITFYGFGYELNGKLAYYYNAQLLNAYKKWNALRNQSIIVTPILTKLYWENELYKLSSRKEEYLNTLHQYIDDDYWEKVKTIYLSKLQIDSCMFNHKLEEYKKVCNEGEVTNLNLYKFLFNI